MPKFRVTVVEHTHLTKVKVFVAESEAAALDMAEDESWADWQIIQSDADTYIDGGADRVEN